jgi:LIM homeobox protein 2/9
MPILERICVGCGTFIDDLYYLMIVNRSWHLSCLKCFDCGILLEQEKTCFTKNGQTFCKDDYRRCVF